MHSQCTGASVRSCGFYSAARLVIPSISPGHHSLTASYFRPLPFKQRKRFETSRATQTKRYEARLNSLSRQRLSSDSLRVHFDAD